MDTILIGKEQLDNIYHMINGSIVRLEVFHLREMADHVQSIPATA